MAKSNSISTSMIYKTLERYSVMLFQMVVQIIIARILAPSEYGVIAMMTVFINIATVFTQNGFNRAVVQKKEAGNVDFGTALTINFIIGCFFYLLIFITAPWIAAYYHNTDIKLCIRVLALILPLGSLNSIQVAIANRQMAFGGLFVCTLVASVLSGVVGVVCAVCGLGVWALIIQQISNVLITTILLSTTLNWKPRFCYDKDSAKSMFSFGWKMMAAALLNTVYNELSSLIIGRRYTSSDLAFYSKGKYFPSMITTGMDAAMDSVMLSSFAKNQENIASLHLLMKKSQNINCYLLFPSLALFAVIAEPVIELALTEKWLPCLPFLYIACFTFAFQPISSSQMQSIAAIGRSDIRLKLEFLKKGVGVLLLIPSIKYGPWGIAVAAGITSICGLIINTVACKKIVRYPISETVKDVFPILLVSLAVMALMFYIKSLIVSPWLQIIVVGLAGFSLYILVTGLLKFFGFSYLKDFVFTKIRSIKK